MKRIDAREKVGERMRVSDLLLFDNDIDVYDNVCESLAIAFCNPFDDDEVHEWSEYLTERGMRQFDKVLDYPIEIVGSDCGMDIPSAILDVDDVDDKVWRARLSLAKRFFYAAAGYCSCEDYDKWFLM